MGVKMHIAAWAEKILFKRVDPIGLAVFRMVISVILACELFQLYTFRHILYDQVPFVATGELDVSYIFLFWGVALLALFVGYRTRMAAVLNYIFSVIIFSSAGSFEYHIFYVYVGVALIALFLPLSAACSVDDWLSRIRWAAVTDKSHEPNKVFAVNYLAPVLVGVGFVYFDSILYKFTSPMWLKGLGMWLPASLPMVIWNDASFILDQKWLMLFLGYLVVAFETIFLFTFWHKVFRVPFMVLGMFFHLGILIIFPIPWFALATMAIYLLMVPIHWWRWIFYPAAHRTSRLIVNYRSDDSDARSIVAAISYFDRRHRISFCALPTFPRSSVVADSSEQEGWMFEFVENGLTTPRGPTAVHRLLKALPSLRVLGVLIDRLGLERWVQKRILDLGAGNVDTRGTSDVLGRIGWGRLIVSLSILQCVVSVASPLSKQALENIIGPRLSGYAAWPDRKVGQLMVNFTGITHHPVFMDTHFQGYEHIMKVVHVSAQGKRRIVPLLDDRGMTSTYVRGAFWVNYTFRVAGAKVELGHLERVRSYLDQFRYTSLDDPLEGYYEVYLRKIDVPQEWEAGFLRKQMQGPWQRVGQIDYRPSFSCTWEPLALQIESVDR